MISGDAAGPPVTRGRRGPVPAKAEGTEEPGLLVGREQRQLNRRRVTNVNRQRGSEEDDGQSRRRGSRQIKRTGTNTAAPRKSKVMLELPCTVRSFSEAIGVPAQQVLRQMLGLGTLANININAEIDAEMAELLAVESGRRNRFRSAKSTWASKRCRPARNADDPALLDPRPPMITFLGHVDHGKTSLLDRIIGIERRQRRKRRHHAAHPRLPDRKGRPQIAFVDTPGHEAFTEMRAAAPMSPTSPCWSWPPTTASCRKPKRPSATPGRPPCRSSWP